MDKDLIVVEYLKIYFSSHPEKVPEDTEKAFELFKQLHKKYNLMFKNLMLQLFKNTIKF